MTANAAEELDSSESILGGHILSMIAVPLWRGDQITGLIQIDNRRSPGMFEEKDLYTRAMPRTLYLVLSGAPAPEGVAELVQALHGAPRLVQ